MGICRFGFELNTAYSYNASSSQRYRLERLAYCVVDMLRFVFVDNVFGDEYHACRIFHSFLVLDKVRSYRVQRELSIMDTLKFERGRRKERGSRNN
jgi:hypothetical protein